MTIKDGSFNHAFVCGSISGVLSSVVVYPLDFIRTRMATRTYDYTKAHHMMANVVRVEGVKTMYNGLVPNIFGVLLYKGYGFYAFENLKSLQKKFNIPKFLDSFIAAGVAGFIGQLVAYPLEIVKRKYMVVSQRDKM